MKQPEQFYHTTQLEIKEEILRDVRFEWERAESKFKLWPYQLSVAMQVINEEMGEANKAALDTEYGRDNLEHVREELVQTAAMCARQIHAIDIRLYLADHPETVAKERDDATIRP